MNRLGRFISALAAALSLLICVATLFLWSRSYRAFDQLSGVAYGYLFTIEADNGQCTVRLVKPYQTRPGVAAGIKLHQVARPFDLLEEMNHLKRVPNYLSRQRWPLAQTNGWRADPPLFPSPAFRNEVVWARDGPGRYNWVAGCQIPYWLACAVFAAYPSLFAVQRIRRARSARPGRCPSCGYDLRASPERCPECGTPAARNKST